ncbi:MAG: BrnT family toxin [Anaerolineales bacterium]|nr:BrnT family toxin [Anaerolineales bacterium]
MKEIRCVWDHDKAAGNQKKHGICFMEAETVFYDEFARVRYDPDHSDDEDRFIILGMSDLLRVLVVCHCYREQDTVIRIISARKATKHEQRQYKAFKQ